MLSNSYLLGNCVDIAVISETRPKKKHVDSCVDIDGYSLFRGNRLGRQCGGIAIYYRKSLAATEWTNYLDRVYEMLWIKVVQNNYVRFIGAI